MIYEESAVVYRVGRRRFLTRRAAIAHAARRRMTAMRACQCEAAKYGEWGRLTSPGYTCPIHDERVRDRYMRLFRRAWKRGWRPE